MTFNSMTTPPSLSIVYPFRYMLSTNFLQKWNNEWSKRSKHKERTNRWHNKRMRRSATYKTRCSWTTQDVRKKRTNKSHLPFITWCHHTPIMKVTSWGKWWSFSSWSWYAYKWRNKHARVTTLLDPTWLTQHSLVP
jgi:hypothetical protein